LFKKERERENREEEQLDLIKERMKKRRTDGSREREREEREEEQPDLIKERIRREEQLVQKRERERERERERDVECIKSRLYKIITYNFQSCFGLYSHKLNVMTCPFWSFTQ
jgi:hypothetical protein